MFFRSFKKLLRQNSNFGVYPTANLIRFAAICVSNTGTAHVATQLLFVLAGLNTVVACETIELEKRPRRRRTVSKAKYMMTLEGKAQHYMNALRVRWMQLHDIPGIFAYQLNVKRKTVLSGKHNFYAELNPDRMLKRRAPQTIESLNPEFKPKHFNFNKVDALEVMMTIEHDKRDINMIVNKSPITPFHTLICPETTRNLVQRITPDSLNFCITFMRSIEDKDIRMGYNSPGALASVNHLHFHLLSMPNDLYIDKADLEELAGGYAYRLSQKMPTEAICFVLSAQDTAEMINEKIQKIHRFTEWLCNKNLPHNLFITHDRRKGKRGDVQVFVFARCTYCVNKQVTAFNVGFCELSGFIPLGDESKMKSLTEQSVIERIQDVTGNAYDNIYERVKLIVNYGEAQPWTEPFTI